jgi:hypothetical protein
MHINVGDLVQSRNDKKIGLVVEKKLPNEGLNCSMHVRHMIDNYPRVYYVLFSDEGRSGPFHETDLMLRQSCRDLGFSTPIWCRWESTEDYSDGDVSTNI